MTVALAFGLAALGWWQGRRPQKADEAEAPTPDEELAQLGLSPVRPRAASVDETAEAEAEEAAPAGSDEAPAPQADVESADAEEREEAVTPAPERAAEPPPPNVVFDETGVSAARPVAQRASPPPSPPAPMSSERYAAAHSPLWRTAAPGAVAALLDSLVAALGAQSAALLRYDEDGDAYVVDALAGMARPYAASFAAEGNALHQVDGDRSISLLEADALDALRYHAEPEAAAGHAAALALDGPPMRVLLVADGAPGTSPFEGRALKHLGAYADLLGHLLDAAATVPAGAEETPPASDAQAGAAKEVRPRADIIAEEMAAARAAERPLAFALVVPRDVEAIEEAGREAVSEAEDALFERLRAVEWSDRVERFGELLAGVFCPTGPTLAETWAERVAATGPPVHIGVALLRARHADAEALRADAAEALRTAYERGEGCVIVE